MRVRTLAVVLLAGGLALTACGKEGTPTDSGTAAGAVRGREGRQGRRLRDVRQDQDSRQASSSASRTTSRVWATRTRRPTSTAASTSRSRSWSPRSWATPRTRSSSRRSSPPPVSRPSSTVTSTTTSARTRSTPPRKEKVGLRRPVLHRGPGPAGAQGRQLDITGKDTLKGKKVCSVTGSTPIKKVQDEGLTEAGEHRRVPELLAVRRPSCSSGAVDAVTTDDAILKGYAAQDAEQAEGRRQDRSPTSPTASACRRTTRRCATR